MWYGFVFVDKCNPKRLTIPTPVIFKERSHWQKAYEAAKKDPSLPFNFMNVQLDLNEIQLLVKDPCFHFVLRRVRDYES